MEDDVVVVAALGEGGEVVACLEDSLLVRTEGSGFSCIESAYFGRMVVVEFKSYRTLREVSND